MTEKRAKRGLFLTGTLAYLFAYVCRLDLTAAMPDIVESGALTVEKLGVITSVYFVCYGVGQLFGGVASDRLPPALLLAVGLGGSAICNMGIFFFPAFVPALVLWAVNGWTQAFVWAPVLKLFTRYYTPDEQLKNLTNVSVAMPVGTLAGYAVSLVVLRFLAWKYVFLVCGLLDFVITLLVLVFVILCSRVLVHNAQTENDKNADSVPHEQAEQIRKPRATRKEMLFPAKKIFLSGFAVVLFPIAAHGALKDGMTSWTPTFLKGVFGIGTTFTLALTMAVAVFNTFGAYLSRYAYKKTGNPYGTAIIFFLIATVALAAFALFGNVHAVLSVAFIVLVTTSMYACNFIFISVLPLSFEKYGCVGTASGLLNSVAYVGTALSCFLLGGMLNKTGWTGVVILWLSLAVVSAVLLFIAELTNKRKTATRGIDHSNK